MRYHYRMGSSGQAARHTYVPTPSLQFNSDLTQTLAGSTVAVFGVGAIGLGVIATSALVKASRVIAIDTNPSKEAWAKKFGATDFVNPLALPKGKRIQDYLVEITDGGLDYTFDCTGNVNVMRAALEACHKGWGVSTIIGVAAAGQEISTRP